MNLQLTLDSQRPAAVREAIDQLAGQSMEEDRGAIFTRPAVVEAMLDLAGYTSDRPLHQRRLLEPSFGQGEFLFAAVRRLLAAAPHSALENAIRAVELHGETFRTTQAKLLDLLTASGMPVARARALTDRWLIQDDFLLAELDGRFDFVVGNPPYVRQERIPAALLLEYRSRFSTLYDRADLYVPFFERSLDLLAPGGKLAFICANRWFKNKYGGPLRGMIARHFHLECVIDLEGADAFQNEVMAYPAITVIEASPSAGATKIALQGRHDAEALADIIPALVANDAGDGVGFTTVRGVASGEDPWLVDVPEVLPILRRLEAELPSLEAAGVQVGIGVATGCDQVFIGDLNDLAVEPERTLPLVMAGDLQGTRIVWSGKGIVNPWETSGELADPRAWPRFSAWLDQHEARLRKRHVARNSERWYRTIDRIYPDLTSKPKLLIPDIKGDATVVYDEGRFYPHHNLYVVTSPTWDLRAVQAILRSSAALMFVAAYCVRMSGGFLRFQAQYLRRIRVPARVGSRELAALAALAEEPDLDRLDAAVLPLYGLSEDEARRVRQFAAAARVGKVK